MFLATWPGSPKTPAGCEAFETEAAALVKARQMTAHGAAHVVVYEIDDDRIEKAS